MTTKLIPLSEYRKNLSRYAREAQTHQIQYIVMVHGKPVFEVRPAREELDEDEILGIIAKKRDTKEAKLITHTEVWA